MKPFVFHGWRIFSHSMPLIKAHLQLFCTKTSLCSWIFWCTHTHTRSTYILRMNIRLSHHTEHNTFTTIQNRLGLTQFVYICVCVYVFLLSVGEFVSCTSNLGLFRDLMSFKVCSIDLKSLLCELGTVFIQNKNIKAASLELGKYLRHKRKSFANGLSMQLLIQLIRELRWFCMPRTPWAANA